MHASRVFVVGSIVNTVVNEVVNTATDTVPAERQGTSLEPSTETDAADLQGCAVLTDVERAVAPRRFQGRNSTTGSSARSSRGPARPAGRRG